jgi:hypothetical protein
MPRKALFDGYEPKALFAEFSEAKVGEDGRLRHKLYQLGNDWVHPYFGEFAITQEMHNQVVQNFTPQNLNYDHVPFGISAGKIVEVEAEADEEGWAWGTSIVTPKAADHINQGEYRGFSIELDFKGRARRRRGKDRGPTVVGGALTNTPFFPIELAASLFTHPTAARGMKKFAEDTMEKLKSRYDAETGQLFVTLEDGSEVEVEIPEAITEALDKTESDSDGDKGSEMPPEVAAALQRVDTLQASVTKLETRAKELEKDLVKEQSLRLKAECDQFLTERHVKPALYDRCRKIYLTDGKEDAEVFLSELGDSAFVPTGQIGTGGNERDKGDVAFIEKEIEKQKTANPNKKTSEILASLNALYPQKMKAYDPSLQ